MILEEEEHPRGRKKVSTPNTVLARETIAGFCAPPPVRIKRDGFSLEVMRWTGEEKMAVVGGE